MANNDETNQSVHGGRIPGEEGNQGGDNNQQLLRRVDVLTELVAKLTSQLEEMKMSSRSSSEQEMQVEMSS